MEEINPNLNDDSGNYIFEITDLELDAMVSTIKAVVKDLTIEQPDYTTRALFLSLTYLYTYCLNSVLLQTTGQVYDAQHVSSFFTFALFGMVQRGLLEKLALAHDQSLEVDKLLKDLFKSDNV